MEFSLSLPFISSRTYKRSNTAQSSLVFESFSDVPTAWHTLCHIEDLGMDSRVLDIFQRTLSDQCRCFGIIVLDASGNAIGAAALALFQTELVEFSSPVLIQLRNRIRKIWPGFLRMGVVFCGLPVPSGSTHLRARAGAEEAVLREVDKVMQKIASMTGAKLRVFKELDNTCEAYASALSSSGYVRGSIPPLHVLNRHYKDFDAYCASLKSRYRAQIRRSQKKLAASGFKVVHGRGSVFFKEHFNDDVHKLYVAMQAKAEQKLELLPASFFMELAQTLNEEVLLTLIKRDGKTHAFSFSITRGQVHYNLYSGLDYALNNEGDLYFNLFYSDLDAAFRAGATELHLGQTSDHFKSRLGTVAVQLRFFVRAQSSLMHVLLRLFSPIAFPKAITVESNEVFNEAEAQS